MKPSIARAGLRSLSTLSAVLLILLALLGVQFLMSSEFAASRRLQTEAARIIQNRTRLAELREWHLEAATGAYGAMLAPGAGAPPLPAPPLPAPPLPAPTPAPALPMEAMQARDTILTELAATGEPATIVRAPELRRLSDVMARQTADLIAAGKRGSLSAAERATMVAIKAEIAAADKAEAAALARLERASENTRSRTQILIALLLLGIALILIATTLLLARAIAQRRSALIATQAVGEQERAMFDGAVDGMLLLDSRGTILRANPSIQRMFLYSEDDLLGRSNTCLMAQPVSEQQSLAWLSRVGNAGVAGAGRRQEFIGKRADGSTFETEVAISRFGQGTDHRFVAVIRDITHRKRAERMKNEFVSTVSHELRTPLTSIGGSLALLAGGAVGELDSKAARLVAIAHANCERLIRLINDLLDIEKMELGKMTFDMRKIDLASLIHRTISANLQFGRDNQVALEVGLPPWPQYVMGDPDRLEQVLTNLISNAIKYSPPHGSVYVTTVMRGRRVRIEVHDRGSGVPEDFRDRIFTKFAMADGSDARLRGGTGLGLAIVREIVAAHGGASGFEDRAGGGSTFWFELPLLRTARIARGAKGSDLPLILHLDDDIDCLDIVASAFAGRAELVSASSIDEARAILSGPDRIAACIVDVAVGSENGLELLPELDPGVPVVIFTAFDEEYESVARDGVLVKSRASLDALVEAVMQLIEQAEQKV